MEIASRGRDTHATPSPNDELDRLGDEIAELSAHLEAATARLLALIREFDARGGWGNGFRSCAAWLSWRVGLDLEAAREKVRVARALGALPQLAEALARGGISYSKVRALTRVATPNTEARLLGVARAGTASHVERIVRGWRQVDRLAEVKETARRHASRALQVYQDEDGMVVVRGRLEPEAGALLMRALDAARETLYRRARGVAAAASVDPESPSAETPTPVQQQADALALLAESALHQGLDPGPPGERYQIVVHVDAPVLADPDSPGQSVVEDGAHVSAEGSRRLACDASRVVDFWTSRDVREVQRSHVNYVVADTAKWEQSAAYVLDTHAAVDAFVKNAGLGFAIPYLHNGQPHDYMPDFVVRLGSDPSCLLILETKGFDPTGEIKAAAAQRWVSAVNADGAYWRWAYAVARQVGDIDGILRRFSESPPAGRPSAAAS